MAVQAAGFYIKTAVTDISAQVQVGSFFREVCLCTQWLLMMFTQMSSTYA